jgi:hypothetical protein
MNLPSPTMTYSKGRAIKPGDIVTGFIDAGSFPAEPFRAQLITILPGGRAEVVFLNHSAPSRDIASSRQQLSARENRVAHIYESAVVKVDGLALRHRGSEPVSEAARELATRVESTQIKMGRPPQKTWGKTRSFSPQP